MARDSGGTYSAPSNSFNPAVSGTVIDEADWNTTLTDLESALTESLYTAATSAVDNAIVRADGTSGVKTQFSQATISDSGGISTPGQITALSTSATPAGGNLAALSMGSAAVAITWGSGVPTVVAPKGSLYLNVAGTSSTTRAYVATSGTGAWTAITTAA